MKSQLLDSFVTYRVIDGIPIYANDNGMVYWVIKNGISLIGLSTLDVARKKAIHETGKIEIGKSRGAFGRYKFIEYH